MNQLKKNEQERETGKFVLPLRKICFQHKKFLNEIIFEQGFSACHVYLKSREIKAGWNALGTIYKYMYSSWQYSENSMFKMKRSIWVKKSSISQ